MAILVLDRVPVSSQKITDFSIQLRKLMLFSIVLVVNMSIENHLSDPTFVESRYAFEVG